MSYPHFEGLDPYHHVKKKRKEILSLRYEPHGLEMTGSMASLADAARETAIALLLVSTLLIHFSFQVTSILICFAITWAFWKMGKSAWLGWFRLERFHRVIEQEKYEIEFHRRQEREELYALYGSKGFSGELLDRVVDVLMADQDRLLKVMLEEELGLVLEGYEHPLKLGFFALLGALIASLIILPSFLFLPPFGGIIAATVVLGCAAAISAYKEKNRILPAVMWNLALGLLLFGILTLLLDRFFGGV